MRKVNWPMIGLCIGTVLLGSLMGGCGNNSGASSSMTPSDEKNFKGGPMPPAAVKGMQEMMNKKGSAPGVPPPAATPATH